MGGKVCLRCKGKTLLGVVNKLCFASLSQVKFPTNNLNFHWRWRWWDQIQAIFLNLFYFKCWHNLVSSVNVPQLNYWKYLNFMLRNAGCAYWDIIYNCILWLQFVEQQFNYLCCVKLWLFLTSFSSFDGTYHGTELHLVTMRSTYF